MNTGNWWLPTSRRGTNIRATHPLSLVDRRFQSLFDDFFGGIGSEFSPVTTEKAQVFNPRIEITEDATGLSVRAELPGLEEKDVEVELTKDHLILKGEKRDESERTEGQTHYTERSFGSFQRAVPLSFEIEEDKVEATFKKGILTVKLPKTSRARSETKKVSVKAA